MKNSKIKIVLTAVLFVLAVVQGNAQISKAEIVATGLTCSMCSNAINKQLKSMPEVESVSTDLNTNTFTVQLKANNTLTPKALKNSIEKTGFFIGSLVLTVDLGAVNGQENEKVQNQSGTYVFVERGKKSAGSLQIQVLNEGFVTKKEFKKSAKMLAKYADFLGQENTYLVKSI
ncbi:heavy-metal-associated domain-containing protein [Flavobacterium turcicum]|uniref:Heavy-metal-associated domain-containing protein n=1 Tax=Flavobacterium turcicum TaxID=2764718 RepID=A0ABR7JD17_9FLAO|nr:heavy metal-associated domain-containing protein [Flavobacterium turcicum]MBC5862397.1 heavy-metal-associated domain-containing protein [Flavobacterium turcicum]NHL01128.1 heavy-metal-associated domain-containing protein [Flavobacterium turcicum]